MNLSQEKNNEILRKLRDNLLHAQKEAKHYKYLYQTQCVDTNDMRKKITKLMKQAERNKTQKAKLEKHLRNFNEFYDTLPVTRKKKDWCHVKCECTKRQHITEYGKSVFTTIQDNIPQCRHAELCLCLGDKTVKYSWLSKHLKLGNTSVTEMLSYDDHSYVARPLHVPEEDDDLIDIDYQQIFDSQGNWQSSHKRNIINVMDSYRISHEAYHELRHAGKGHFPPLHHIIKENNIMSDVIPYVKHPTVSFLIRELCTKSK